MKRLMEFLFPVPDQAPESYELIIKGVFWVALMMYGVQLFWLIPREIPEHCRFLHMVNLVFHEAGHVIFGFQPSRQITVLGGSLMQCLVPFVLMVSFLWKQKSAFSAGICLWWFGENLADCSPYINDARMLALTLLGGATGAEIEGHDWEYLLTQWNLLDSDVIIAWWVLKVGKILMVVGLAWALMSLVVDWRRKQGAG